MISEDDEEFFSRVSHKEKNLDKFKNSKDSNVDNTQNLLNNPNFTNDSDDELITI